MGLERKRENGKGARKIREMGAKNRMGGAREYGKEETEVGQIKNEGSKKGMEF